MPTRGPSPLSVAQVEQVRAELDAGRTPMVWFTPAAVGVDAGRSAKVVSLTEPYEGDFIQVRPTGSHDALSFSTNELTMDKPARRRKAPEPTTTPPPPAAQPPTPEPAKPATPAPEVVDELLVIRERPTRKPTTTSNPTTSNPTTSKPTTTQKTQKPTKAPRTKQPTPLTVTLNSTADGEWTVEVQAGTRRTVKPQPVGAGAVAAAAKALGGDIESAIEGALSAARERQQARVAQLEAELAVARQALDELAD